MERTKNDTYLPNELVDEILLRLHVKSLGQCKSVCRRWYNLIQSPNFIDNHFHHPQNPTNLFAGIPDKDYVFKLFGDESFSFRQDIRNPINNPPKHKLLTEVILGPVNGLFFMSYSNEDGIKVCHQALWNPSTSEFRELPSLTSSQQTRNVKKHLHYFGFGSTGKDIKVIGIANLPTVDNLSDAVMIRLYSLNDDSLKDIQYDSVRFPFIATGVRPFYNETYNHLNGVCYWVVTTDYQILFLFDMKSEEFREVDLPPLPTDTRVEVLAVRDNSSIVLLAHQGLEIVLPLVSGDLWEMKNEGEWFKLLSFDPSSAYVSLNPMPCGFWKKDEILIRTEGAKLVLYNMNSHDIKDLELDCPYYVVLLIYKESLTSVKKARSLGF